MAKISSPCSNSDEARLQFYNTNREINCKQKTCNIAKKIFCFLYRNQNALAVAIWSYVCIEVGVAASEFAFGEKYVFDLDSCRNVLCEHWTKNMDTRYKAPHHIEARCNPSHRKHSSLYSFVECMNELCEYMSKIGQKFYACTGTFNKSRRQPNSDPIIASAEEESNFTLELWSKICPKKIFKRKNGLKELAYLNKCIKRLCNHSAVFKINLDKDMKNWCHNMSVNKLYKLLKKLTKLLDESQKKNPMNGHRQI